jgi:subfamily B ATP-binding cassette protein HlyB/CyaB
VTIEAAKPSALRDSPDSGAWALALALQVLGLAADADQIVHDAGAPEALSEDEVLRAAQRFPVKARAVTTTVARLRTTPLPAIALLKDGRFAVIGQVGDKGVLTQSASDGRPMLREWAAFGASWSGRLILMSRRAAISDLHRRFGLGWFWSAVQKYRGILYEVLLSSFFIQIFALITPLIFQVVIDKVLVHRGFSTLTLLVVGLGLVSVFDVVLSGIRSYVFAHTSNRIDVELGARIYRHLVALPFAYFQARRVGDSVARVRELETIRHFITGSALTLVLDLFFGIVFVATMFLYSATLAWIVVATIPLYAVLAAGLTPLFRARLDEKFTRGAENQAFLVETVTGIETVKAMAVEPLVQREWENQLAGYVQASFRAQTLGTVGNQITSLISKLTTVVTLLVGARLVIDNVLTVGELVAFNMLSGQVTGPVLRLAQIWQDFHQVRISVERVGDILNSAPEPRPSSGSGQFGRLKGEIELRNVTFRYRPDAQPVLRNLSLALPAGQVTGVVGMSGSGKSTVAKLIQRLYVPEQGQVLVDGYDLALVDPAWLRRQIGVVLQENVLFNRSVRQNIALTNPAIELSQVIRAAELAGAHEFIAAMPQAYDTIIGERGASLSGGQRQRIAIARALLNDPRILIFDEATSALDYESESIIQTNMRQIVRDRTVLIIAHRLSTVRSADRIVTIEQGEIVEDGTHTELLAAGGRYARLHRLQSETEH